LVFLDELELDEDDDEKLPVEVPWTTKSITVEGGLGKEYVFLNDVSFNVLSETVVVGNEGVEIQLVGAG